jgi:hypothetical protein
MATETPIPKPTPPSSLVRTLPRDIDAFLTHLNKALATPSGIDTVMLFLCYTSRLSSSLLTLLSQSLLRRSARSWLGLLTTLPRGTTVLLTEANKPPTSAAAAARAALVLAGRLKALSGLLSEARMILRLWALLGMYFWAKGLVSKTLSSLLSSSGEKSPKDKDTTKTSKLATALENTRLTLCVALQALENGAYLSQRGVLGWSPAKQGLAYKWSARFWAAYVGIEIGKLLAEGTAAGSGTKGPYEAKEKETIQWRKKVARNMAWMPLTIHWSTDSGIVNEPLVGLLASIPGIIQIRDLWAETA